MIQVIQDGDEYQAIAVYDGNRYDVAAKTAVQACQAMATRLEAVSIAQSIESVLGRVQMSEAESDRVFGLISKLVSMTGAA